MILPCMTPGCLYTPVGGNSFCAACSRTKNKDFHPSDIYKAFPHLEEALPSMTLGRSDPKNTMADLYPKYYKRIPKEWDSIDVYGVCALFPVKDDTGCIHHALKKLLVPGTRTGGKSFREDIKEARDTLTRWLELNPVSLCESGSPESFKK